MASTRSRRLRYKKEHGTLIGFPGTDDMSNAGTAGDPLRYPGARCAGRPITETNAGRIKAKMIAEAANGPTTPEADRILHEKGIMVLPDILANAGGVTVSYFEWAQNIQGYYWTEEEVDERLHRVMSRAFKDVYETAQQQLDKHAHRRVYARHLTRS